MEIDDDVFFADLSKQIALLLMDDDGEEEVEEEEEFPVKQRPLPLPVQGFAYVPRQSFMPLPPPPLLAYDQLACRRESKGTGVFIPRSSLPRRKNRSGRPAPISTNSSRQPDRSGVTCLTDTNCRYSDGSCHSALPKRHP